MELLEQKNLSYVPPALERRTIRELAGRTLPNEKIYRDFVTEMVGERYQRLEQGIQTLNIRQDMNPMELK